jgi:hypothetical protein
MAFLSLYSTITLHLECVFRITSTRNSEQNSKPLSYGTDLYIFLVSTNIIIIIIIIIIIHISNKLLTTDSAGFKSLVITIKYHIVAIFLILNIQNLYFTLRAYIYGLCKNCICLVSVVHYCHETEKRKSVWSLSSHIDF